LPISLKKNGPDKEYDWPKRNGSERRLQALADTATRALDELRGADPGGWEGDRNPLEANGDAAEEAPVNLLEEPVVPAAVKGVKSLMMIYSAISSAQLI
jgi:hypothetical protein